MQKTFNLVDHNKLWKILKEMGVLDHLTYLLRNLYAVRTGTWNNGLVPIGKGVCQGYVLSHCLFNLYTEYIIWNAGLGESQIGLKVAGRNISNLRYADDTIPVAENEEELKNLLTRVKKEQKSQFKAKY